MMTRARRPRPPLWLELAVCVGLSLALRALFPHGLGPPGVDTAFFAWLILVGEAIAAGLQAVGHAVLIALSWSVNALWIVFRELGLGVKAFAGQFLAAGKKLWQFSRELFTNVLRPAWEKFWHFVEWARRTLDHLFRPVFEFLNTLRRELLKFYSDWVRPILDSIGIARKVLHVFSALGLDWARRLDAELGKLEERIDAPFRYVLGKINEVINFVNRIATADGLFQRLALIRSIERDIREVRRAFVNAFARPLEDADVDDVQEQLGKRKLADVHNDTSAALSTNTGPYASWADEMAATARDYLR